MQVQAPIPSSRSGSSLTRRPFRILTLSALALTSLLGPSLPVAFAGPDDGKIVTTQTHIDAPKTAWIDDRFVLRNEAPPQAGKDGPYAADESIIWLGKGWSDWSGKSQYTFVVDDDPQQSFLGKVGDSLYLAPMLPEGNHNPAWVGYGAELDIPVEKFRDGTFALDIMEVRGPGEIELFRHHSGWGPLSLKRMMSSKTPGLNSALLSPGNHTHNATTFSTAGRYEVVYRTVARGHDGEVIQSEPTTMVWQVGGQSPRPGSGVADGVDTLTRYRQAPVGDLEAEKYSLTLGPYEEGMWSGDDKLTQIDFSAANEELEGTLTLYNNGYFLTDLDVHKGRASWLELLGSTPGQLQAVFTPEGDTGARWISQPLPYAPGERGQTDSAAPEGAWPQEQPDPDNIKMTGELYTPSNGSFTATIEPAEEEGYKRVRVQAQDPHFRGFLAGGFKGADSPYYSSTFEGHFVDGVAEYIYPEDGFYDGEQAVVEVIPHPDMNARSASLTLAEDYRGDQSYQGQGAFELTQSPQETPQEPEAPQPTLQPSPSPTPTSEQPRCSIQSREGRPVLTDGHIDLKGRYDGERLRAVLRDETGQIDAAATDRSLEDVVLALGDNSRQHRSGHLLDPAYDFLGEPGSRFYGLPQTQQAGLIWPGWNTQELDYSQFDGPVSLHLNPLSIPDGARYAIYQDSAFGSPNLLVDSGSGDYSLEVGFPTHAHANWVFSTPGVYELEVYYSATTQDGQQTTSDPQKLTYVVGSQAIQDCLKEDGEPVASPTPGDKQTSAPASSSPLVPDPGTPSARQGAVTGSLTGNEVDTNNRLEAAGDQASKPHTGGPGGQTLSGATLASTGASVLGALACGALALAGGVLVLRQRRAR